MLRGKITQFSLSVLVVLISSCFAEKYDFSWHPDPKPEQKNFVMEGKWLTFGDSCKTQSSDLCRYSADLRCIDGKCACDDNTFVWDPKVEYISSDVRNLDNDQKITGKCAVPKGETCSQIVGKHGTGHQCVSDATCNIIIKTSRVERINHQTLAMDPFKQPKDKGKCE